MYLGALASPKIHVLIERDGWAGLLHGGGHRRRGVGLRRLGGQAKLDRWAPHLGPDKGKAWTRADVFLDEIRSGVDDWVPLRVPLHLDAVRDRLIDLLMAPHATWRLVHHHPRPYLIDDSDDRGEDGPFCRHLLGPMVARFVHDLLLPHRTTTDGHLRLPERQLRNRPSPRRHTIQCGSVVKGCPHWYGRPAACLDEVTRRATGPVAI